MDTSFIGVAALRFMIPWSCPACWTETDHIEEHPRLGVIFRCHIYRLEFVGNLELPQLVLAPLSTDEDGSDFSQAGGPSTSAKGRNHVIF